MKKTKALFVWIFIIGALAFLTFPFSGLNSQNSPKQIIYSDFIKDIENSKIKAVQMFLASPIDPTHANVIYGQYKTGQIFKTIIPEQDVRVVEKILAVEDIDLKVNGNNYMSKYLLYQLLNLFPLLFLIGLMVYSVRQSKSGGGAGGGFGGSPFGFSKNKPIKPTDANKVTFQDVAGIDEAKQELEEIVDFLRSPEKFQRLGGRIPRGVLLVGDPGNGKTLLARAIAGEAEVPFFSIAGSDFVEVFVGVGASRVRKIFENAKKNSPCIIFIDEIDAIGRKRDSSLRGGNDEREQTLNQLLVEMDGFEGNQGVIVIAATNRVDILDPALLRPGRFDRRISVDYPDLVGREKILKVHSKKVPLAHDVNLNTIARGTPGFSGAELANLVNEASLLAARKNKLAVYMSDFEVAKDKVMMGAEHKSYRMTQEEIKLTAYHESGHALIALLSKKTDPIHKVTIVPRGQALGMVMQLPENDKVSVTKLEMLCNIKICMGGRAAEEIFFGAENVTTGAYSDMKQATNTAKKMIMKCGMNDKLGLRTFFISDTAFDESDKVSQRTAEIMDTEIENLLKSSYEEVKQTIIQHRDKLEEIANTLLKCETLTGEEVKQIFEGTYVEKKSNLSTSAVNLDDFALGGMPNNENDFALGGVPNNENDFALGGVPNNENVDLISEKNDASNEQSNEAKDTKNISDINNINDTKDTNNKAGNDIHTSTTSDAINITNTNKEFENNAITDANKKLENSVVTNTNKEIKNSAVTDTNNQFENSSVINTAVSSNFTAKDSNSKSVKASSNHVKNDSNSSNNSMASKNDISNIENSIDDKQVNRIKGNSNSSINQNASKDDIINIGNSIDNKQVNQIKRDSNSSNNSMASKDDISNIGNSIDDEQASDCLNNANDNSNKKNPTCDANSIETSDSNNNSPSKVNDLTQDNSSKNKNNDNQIE